MPCVMAFGVFDSAGQAEILAVLIGRRPAIALGKGGFF